LQVWFPPDEFVELLAQGDSAIFGKCASHMSTQDHQWFTDFLFRFEGRDVVRISARKGSDLLAAAAPAVNAQSEGDDGKALQTLSLVVDGRTHINNTGTVSACDSDVTLMVSQHKARIGPAHKEAVLIESRDLSIKVFSAAASKFKFEEDRLRFLHLDMSVIRMEAGKVTGALPEVWGLVEMSKATEAILKKPMGTEDAFQV